MDIIQAIRTRRSIRSFRPDPVPKEILIEILETCLWAPSSSNTQTWEFAVLGGKVLDELNDLVVEKVKTEWRWAVTAFNLAKLVKEIARLRADASDLAIVGEK